MRKRFSGLPQNRNGATADIKLHALHERTAMDTKKERMKFWCIVFGCPVRGENTAHSNFLLCFCIAKKQIG